MSSFKLVNCPMAAGSSSNPLSRMVRTTRLCSSKKALGKTCNRFPARNIRILELDGAWLRAFGELKAEVDKVVLSKALAKEHVREKLSPLVSSFRSGGRLTNLDRSATIGSIRVRFCLLSEQRGECQRERESNLAKHVAPLTIAQ